MPWSRRCCRCPSTSSCTRGSTSRRTAPLAVLHREFYHSTGAFRAGPPIDELETLFASFVTQTNPKQLTQIATAIDQYACAQALSLFLCAPRALYALNHHVNFVGYATTFELAETEAGVEHWSRR